MGRISPKAKKEQPAIPTKFHPKFWEEADGRCAVVRQIRKRYEALRQDTGANSLQKDTLLRRAVFLELQLETLEREAVETRTLDSNRYVVLLNSFLGLLKALGLKKATKNVEDLESYLEEAK